MLCLGTSALHPGYLRGGGYAGRSSISGRFQARLGPGSGLGSAPARGPSPMAAVFSSWHAHIVTSPRRRGSISPPCVASTLPVFKVGRPPPCAANTSPHIGSAIWTPSGLFSGQSLPNSRDTPRSPGLGLQQNLREEGTPPTNLRPCRCEPKPARRPPGSQKGFPKARLGPY